MNGKIDQSIKTMEYCSAQKRNGLSSHKNAWGNVKACYYLKEATLKRPHTFWGRGGGSKPIWVYVRRRADGVIECMVYCLLKIQQILNLAGHWALRALGMRLWACRSGDSDPQSERTGDGWSGPLGSHGTTCYHMASPPPALPNLLPLTINRMEWY